MGGGTSRKVKRVYLGINDVSHKVKKGYIGDESGKARLFYSSGRVWKKYNVTRRYTYYWDRFNIATQYTWSRYTYQMKTSKTYSQLWDMTVDLDSAGRAIVYTGSGNYTINSNGTIDVGSGHIEIRLGSQRRTAGITARSNTGNSAVYGLMSEEEQESQFGDAEVAYYVWHDSSGRVTIGNKTGIGANIYRLTVSPTKGTLQGTVSSANQSQYPNNGISGSYWYEYTGSTQSKGSTQYSDVSSSSRSAYPDNGVSGNYWYVYDRSSVSYLQGSYISDVEADPGTYPSNGRHSDGYWYVLQPE